MNCAECREQIVGYLEAVLSAPEAQEVETHLHACPTCSAEAAEDARLRDRLMTDAIALGRVPLDTRVLDRVVREQTLKLRRTAMNEVCGCVDTPSQTEQQTPAESRPAHRWSWRTLVRNRTAQIAAAAALALALGAGWMMLGVWAKPAYAISQTLEAIQRVYGVHMIGRDWDGRQLEMWLEMAPAASKTSSFRIDEKDAKRLTVGTPGRVYYYDRNDQTVRVVEGGALETWVRWDRLREDIDSLAERYSGQVEYSTTRDEATGREMYVARITIEGIQLESVADPETLLPVRFHFNAPEGRRLDWPFKQVDSITYPSQFPPELFAFDVPAGARVLNDTPEVGRETADRMVSGGIVAYAVSRHEKAPELAGAAPLLPVNTLIFMVDGGMNLRSGGIVRAANYTGRSMAEVGLGGFNDPGISLFDQQGVPLRTRTVQKSLLTLGKFLLFWLPDEPLPPGASRCLLWAEHRSEALTRDAAGRGHALEMNNHFGSEVLESFILVVPAGARLVESSTPAQTQTSIGGNDVYVWFKRNPKDTTNRVNVVLAPATTGSKP